MISAISANLVRKRVGMHTCTLLLCLLFRNLGKELRSCSWLTRPQQTSPSLWSALRLRRPRPCKFSAIAVLECPSTADRPFFAHARLHACTRTCVNTGNVACQYRSVCDVPDTFASPEPGKPGLGTAKHCCHEQLLHWPAFGQSRTCLINTTVIAEV